jgi:hypothetical protein
MDDFTGAKVRVEASNRHAGDEGGTDAFIDFTGKLGKGFLV